MTWLAFIFALQAGIIPQNSFVMYQKTVSSGYEINWAENTGPIYFTDMKAEIVLFEPYSLFFGGGARFQMSYCAGGFDPQSIFYQLSVGVRYGGIELYLLHACRHPQMTYSYQYTVASGWEGAYDEIGIKFSGKVDLIKSKK